MYVLFSYIYIYMLFSSPSLSLATPAAVFLFRIPEISIESLDKSWISRWSLDAEVLHTMLLSFPPKLRPWNLKYKHMKVTKMAALSPSLPLPHRSPIAPPSLPHRSPSPPPALPKHSCPGRPFLPVPREPNNNININNNNNNDNNSNNNNVLLLL